ncbi:Dabb family protein [Microbacterium sp. RD1]|uniref:Dabb family protein n=1 Tax=Microbacterium sp. RD1 TaxID=3457313 RepID=UPI003FA5CA0C
MILHIATFRWKEHVGPADVDALTQALHEMAAQIPEIRSYSAGANLHLRPGGSDFGVAALMDDKAGLDTYLDHPLHQEVYASLLGNMLAERSAVQLEVSQGSFQ